MVRTSIEAQRDSSLRGRADPKWSEEKGAATSLRMTGDACQPQEFHAKFSIHPIETLRWYFRAAAHKVALRQI
jgi:hypothetical protein